MCLAQVHDGSDPNDLELRSNVADLYMFFLPGLASGLRNIALEDEKSGHKTTMVRIFGTTFLYKRFKVFFRWH